MIRAALTFFAILLAGCSSQPMEPNYYLLRSDSDLSTRALQPATDYALGKVTIAPYIDQRGLLMETADGDLRAARLNLWAEPVYEGVRLYLLKEISAKSGADLLPAAADTSMGRINVRIDQLHGTNNGHARLVAYWWLEREGKVVAAYQFAEEEVLAADGYTALAAAQEELLSHLSQQIADSLVATRSAAE